MIDSHCHLYLQEFDKDIDQIFERALAARVFSFYLPAINSDTHASMLELEKKYAQCHSMMGLHPCYVKENFKDELKIADDYLAERAFCAIGEIGLDFYWDSTCKIQQYEAFHYQINKALQYQLPIVIHSRNATKECIEVVQQYKSKGLKGIFHCFGGTIEEAIDIISCNFLLGIGGVVTYKNSGLPEVLAHIDVKHLLLETDAPYLTPVPFRGKRNESSYISFIAKKIAEIKQITIEELEQKTDANAIVLFNQNKLS